MGEVEGGHGGGEGRRVGRGRGEEGGECSESSGCPVECSGNGDEGDGLEGKRRLRALGV